LAFIGKYFSASMEATRWNSNSHRVMLVQIFTS
jgi:hypothetical protein